MSELEGLSGREYGPVRLGVGQEKVHEYVAVTGDDPERWESVAPPGFAAVALFAVAPLLLSEPVVMETGGVIHGDQRFHWHRALEVGLTGQVSGTVGKVRARGAATFVGFDMEWSDIDGPIVSGSSMFVVAALADGEIDEVTEPAATERAAQGVSPSRSDLVRYAGATRDWNPIHWDHDAAVAAGLGGIVVHGLLQTAWMIQEAVAERHSVHPLTSARFRFREPLRPAVAVGITGDGDKYELASDEGVHLSGDFS